ncbi:MAG: metallophosphoesterase [Bryobacteraceae bacterium]
MRRIIVIVWISVFVVLHSQAPGAGAAPAAPNLTLPLIQNSVRFAVIGDMGTGKKPQYEVAEQMVEYRKLFPYDFVITLGDNIYGSQSAAEMKTKFEDPYQALLSAGVLFYASIGNHDNGNQRLYKPFNMGGKRYYTFKKGKVEFFVLDSNYMDRTQTQWLEEQLSGSTAPWKICYFHHPLYSHGRFHGPDTDLRTTIEPLFQKYKVQVVFSGHEHVYERLVPQHGITYFVLGNSGELRPHNLSPSPDTAKGFDTDQTFGMVEVADDELYFQIVSRHGVTVDSGTVNRQPKAAAASAGL